MNFFKVYRCHSAVTFLFICALVLCPGLPAEAKERISEYWSEVIIGADSTIKVYERITVQAEGDKIKRGIVRVFPTRMTNPSGATYNTGFKFLDAHLDGKAVPYTVEQEGGDFFIFLGNPDGRLPDGEHVYELLFNVTDHLLFLPDRDSLYWNVTGNELDFPVDQAVCMVFLPCEKEEAENFIIEYNAYTGKIDEAGTDWDIQKPTTFYTTRTLEKGEGFTIALDLKPGLIQERKISKRNQIAEIIGPYRWLGLLTIPLFAFLVFGIAWLIAGRNPELGIITPLFDPPDGMMPGFMAMLRSARPVQACFTANLLRLATGGLLRLDSPKRGTLVLTLLNKDPLAWLKKENAALKRETIDPEYSDSYLSTKMIRALFPNPNKLVDFDEKTMVVDSRQNKTPFADAYERCYEQYEELAKTLFTRTYWPYVTGLIFLIIFISWVMYILPCQSYTGLDSTVEFMMMLGMSLVVLWLVKAGVQRAIYHADLGFGRAARVGLASALVLLGGLMGGGGLWYYAIKIDPWLTAAVISLIPIIIFFWRAMPVPTKDCRQLLTQAEGLAMYIKAAEQDRLAWLNSPKKTIERFEYILPYAVALGCAKAWEKHFASLLETINYQPDWRGEKAGSAAGTAARWTNTRTVTAAMSSSYASAITTYKANRDIKSSLKSGISRSGRSGSSGGGSGRGSGGGGVSGW